MQWILIEKAFSRALSLALSRKKISVAFPVLGLCGLLVVFARAVAFDASDWVSLSLTFLPILLSSGLLLSLGVIVIRLHYHEVKQLAVSLRKLLVDSLDLIIGTSYLSFPSVLAYLALWIVLGLFFLMRQIPGFGDFFSVVLAFGPFLLIFASLLLVLANLAILFFVAPLTALQSVQKESLLKRSLGLVQQRPLSAIGLFLLGLTPAAVLVGLLSVAARLTDVRFMVGQTALSVALEWFFIMVPFCALMTPTVIFFFNFAAESYQLLQTRESIS